MLNMLKTCLSFLDTPLRWRWAFLIPFVVTAAVLETGGAAAIFTLVKVVENPVQTAQLPIFAFVTSLLPWKERQAVVISCTVLVLIFYLIKNSLLIVAAYLQSWTVTNSIVTVSQRLFKAYLSAPYSFHLQHNSSELIYKVDKAVETIFRSVLASAVMMVSESLVSLGLLSLLFLAAPTVTLAALFILGGLFTCMVRVTGRYSTRWGNDVYEMKQTLLQNLQQSLSGVKEIQVTGRGHFFAETFTLMQQELARTLCLRTTLSATPHIFVETVFVCGVLVIVLAVSWRGELDASLLPLLGLYAYAGFRIIPSANRLLMHVGAMKFGAAAVEQVQRDFQLLQQEMTDIRVEPPNNKRPFRRLLQSEHLSYTYENVSEPALRDLNFIIRRGESVGIVGPTGSGKSTLIDLILGLLHPSHGRITVDGRDIATCVRAWQRQIGYVPQNLYLLDGSLWRNIALGVEDSDIDEQRVRQAIGMAQLETFIATLPKGLETVVGERGVRLSGGERQRVAIARALYQDPDVLIFDEATSALDNQTERELTQAIEALQGQKTLLIIAHRLSTVRHCDRLLFLQNGQLVDCGSFAELVERNSDFRAFATLSEDGSRS